VLGESLAMADPDLAFYVECNEALRARHEALLERATKLERALNEIVCIADDATSFDGYVDIAGVAERALDN
jgi:hypothetical protein